jgi:hypothetical protein
MDPEQALRDLRAAVSAQREAESAATEPGVYRWATIAMNLADAAETLDEWLSKGGYAPRAWRLTHEDGAW